MVEVVIVVLATTTAATIVAVGPLLSVAILVVGSGRIAVVAVALTTVGRSGCIRPLVGVVLWSGWSTVRCRRW